MILIGIIAELSRHACVDTALIPNTHSLANRLEYRPGWARLGELLEFKLNQATIESTKQSVSVLGLVSHIWHSQTRWTSALQQKRHYSTRLWATGVSDHHQHTADRPPQNRFRKPLHLPSMADDGVSRHSNEFPTDGVPVMLDLS